MKVLVTGGLGYLGGNIACSLKKNLSYDVAIATRSLVKGAHKNSIKQILIDWKSRSAIESLCYGYDAVIHCAGMGASACASHPYEAFEFNCLATAALVQGAYNSGVKHFIYFSTAHVYKSPLSGEIDETSLVQNLHPYASSHRAAEDIVLRYHGKKGMQCLALRLSNAIGSPLTKKVNCWNLLMNDISKQLIMNGKIKLNSNGDQKRNFVTISDVTRVVHHVLNIDLLSTMRPVYNIGGNWNISILEAANFLQNIYSNVLKKSIFEVSVKSIPSSINKSDNFLFRNDKICATGFIFSNDYSSELTDLIIFCNNSFNKNS